MHASALDFAREETTVKEGTHTNFVVVAVEDGKLEAL